MCLVNEKRCKISVYSPIYVSLLSVSSGACQAQDNFMLYMLVQLLDELYSCFVPLGGYGFVIQNSDV